MGDVVLIITTGYVAIVRLASAAVYMGGVVIRQIIAHRAIAIVGTAIRRWGDRVRMALVARISRVIRFVLEQILESVVVSSKYGLLCLENYRLTIGSGYCGDTDSHCGKRNCHSGDCET